MTQLGRVSVLESESRRFKSYHTDQFVSGGNPVCGITRRLLQLGAVGLVKTLGFSLALEVREVIIEWSKTDKF